MQVKVQRAIKLLQSIGSTKDDPVEVAYSGGKDSDVILRLARESGIPFRAIYKNTTIDPPFTAKHVRENGVEVRIPNRTFFKMVAAHGLPNRFQRFCCRELKEYKVLDKCIMGVRRAESTKRSLRYQEPTECKYYGKKTPENHVEAFYPILDWTDDDVLEFINVLNIKLHPIYYKEDGSIDIKQRLGCMCCPLTTEKKRVAAFKAHPNMVKAYLRACKVFWDNHPNSKTRERYANIYEWFTRDVFFHTQREFDEFLNGMFGRTDCKEFLEQQFNIKL